MINRLYWDTMINRLYSTEAGDCHSRKEVFTGFLDITCPYCGTKLSISDFHSGPNLIECYNHHGAGCERHFVVDVDVKVFTKVRRVEGCEDFEKEGGDDL